LLNVKIVEGNKEVTVYLKPKTGFFDLEKGFEKKKKEDDEDGGGEKEKGDDDSGDGGEEKEDDAAKTKEKPKNEDDQKVAEYIKSNSKYNLTVDSISHGLKMYSGDIQKILDRLEDQGSILVDKKGNVSSLDNGDKEEDTVKMKDDEDNGDSGDKKKDDDVAKEEGEDSDSDEDSENGDGEDEGEGDENGTDNGEEGADGDKPKDPNAPNGDAPQQKPSFKQNELEDFAQQTSDEDLKTFINTPGSDPEMIKVAQLELDKRSKVGGGANDSEGQVSGIDGQNKDGGAQIQLETPEKVSTETAKKYLDNLSSPELGDLLLHIVDDSEITRKNLIEEFDKTSLQMNVFDKKDQFDKWLKDLIEGKNDESLKDMILGALIKDPKVATDFQNSSSVKFAV